MVQIISADSVGLGTRVTMLGGEMTVVTPGVLVATTGSFAIAGAAENLQLMVFGTVISDFAAANIGDFTGLESYHQLTVQAGGAIAGGWRGAAIWGGNATVTNHGLISGNGGEGLLIYSELSGTSTIYNDGTIEGQLVGINLTSNNGETFIIRNFGLIHGLNAAIESTDSSIQTVMNRGTLVGQVLLGAGTDTFDGRGGTAEDGVFGGLGDDLFIAGADADYFDGGAGTDTLDFSRQGAVTVALGNDVAGTRTATGDFYSGIEALIGSRLGNDRLYGDFADNQLNGLGGNDRLDGQYGNDLLIGAAGVDTLTGGLGFDAFRYDQLADCGDTITDFRSAFGDVDHFEISAFGFSGGFGGPLVAGMALNGKFIKRPDNLAQDGNDYFILNTTDKTFWFDADGNGSAAAVMIADLQQSANFLAIDIVII